MASYERAPNGTWSVRFRAIENFELKQKRLSGFKTKKEAELAYLEYKSSSEEEKKINVAPGSKSLSFENLYEEYKEYQRQRIKESSFVDLVSKVELHIVPYFKSFLVLHISPKTILNWQNSLEKYSYKYKSTLRTYLHSILKYAERYYKIPNQIKYVDSFKKTEPKKEMEIWEEEDFIQFIESIKSPLYKAFFSALYLTGARKGEILATYWADWDLENKTLNINKNVTRKVIDKNKRYALTTPKNETSIRKIAIPDNLINLITNYKKTINNPVSNEFAFGGEKPIASSTIDNAFNSACKKSQVKKIRLHDFRHSHASYLISKGVSIVAVAKRLGHSNIEQTLNTYSHLLKNEESELILKLDNIKI